jgi:hypothetical protein
LIFQDPVIPEITAFRCSEAAVPTVIYNLERRVTTKLLEFAILSPTYLFHTAMVESVSSGPSQD